MNVVLTVAGSDSGGGAGIQADLRTFAAHRVHGTSALTAVTAQNSVGVTAWTALDPAMVIAQIEAVASDMPLAAVKTGMLASAAIIRVVADTVSRLRLAPLVVDPVMVAKSGDRLLDDAAERAYVEALFPHATLVTPNLHEATALLGRPVADLEAMRQAARDLRARGPRAVLVKGGALAGDPIDVFFDGQRLVELPGPRVNTPNVHGAGCTLSAAIAARLALGAELLDAVRGAKEYLTEGLRRSFAVGRGRGIPDHLHPLIR
ncbi:MAG TPA: bifunctional hydroxymethylpyrimidine kinase/phosphomethylpyrimidine kinase [Anaeromyxobacter sp.]